MTPHDAPRILLHTDDPERGGVAQYNHSLLMAMAARDWTVSCTQTPSDSPLVQAQREAGVQHDWLPYDTAREFGRTIIDMETPRAIFLRRRPDLIVFSDCCPVSNIGARQAALALRIPYVVVVGFAAGYLAKQFAPVLPLLASHYAAARQVVAVSEENLRLLRSHFNLAPRHGTVIHYGRPDVFFAPADAARRQQLRSGLGLADDAVVSVTAARLAKLKGHHRQLAALQRLAQSGLAENLHLIWLGDGEARPHLEKEIERLGLQDRVTLLGQRWDTADWLEAADFFTLPTDYEGMPLAIMEAMAKGLPVAATAVSGIPEEIGDTGALLPDPAVDEAATIASLAATFAGWSEDDQFRRHLGDAARRRADAMFRESRMVDRTLALVESALPDPAPAAA